MKNSGIVIRLTISFFLFLGLTTNLMAKQEGKKILLEKTFDINTDAHLLVEHEFGEVTCSNWDRNAIGIKITAHWKVKSESSVQKMLDKVEMEVYGDRNKVVVRCRPGHKQSNENNSLSLLLEIRMPRSINLEMRQKFGSAFVESLDGTAKLVSEYGTLQVEELNNTENKIRLEFGSGSLQHLTAGKVKVSYSSFELKTAGNISLVSEYSDIKISQKVKRLSIELTGGNLEVSKVANLKLEAEYSNADIDKLTHSAEIETAYGGVDVHYIGPDFTSLLIENEFGSVDLKIDESATFSFEAASEYGEISFPKKNANLSYQKKTNAGSTYLGVIGKGEARSKVTVESHYGSVSLSN
jgi:hypothetical protein